MVTPHLVCIFHKLILLAFDMFKWSSGAETWGSEKKAVSSLFYLVHEEKPNVNILILPGLGE